MIRAKMRCDTAVIAAGSDAEQVVLWPVCDDANKSWSQWTPAGKLELWINNPDAQGKFKVGEHYFVDFSPAPARESDEK